jgi:ubiquinone/menaquinone biosynthesis C-methylase UbiE
VVVEVGSRLRGEFIRRLSLRGRRSIWEPAYLYFQQERERAILALLGRHGFNPMTNTKVLEIGCGSGAVLADFLRFGVPPSNAIGIDVDERRVADASERYPQLEFRHADAARMPFPDRSFDLVLAFTVFSSIPDPAHRSLVANEVLRVLRPGGAVLWYDFWINPINSETKALGIAEIRRLFGREPTEARRITLAPPIARLLAKRSWIACELLSKVLIFRTHWLALVRA